MTVTNPRRRALLAAAAAAPLAAMWQGAVGEGNRMQQRTIAGGNDSLPVVGLGTWQAFDYGGDTAARAEARDALQALFAQGGRAIDSSPMYGGAEAAVGSLLEELKPNLAPFLCTKVWTSGRAEGQRQIEASFRALRATTIDLFQVHNLLDADTQLETLHELKRAGRIRYVGLTHYTKSAHAELVRRIERGGIDFVQINYSLLERDAARSVLPAAAAHGVAVLINRPFAEGAVFKRTKGRPLPPWAAEFGCVSWAQFALKYILAQPAVTCAIPGTRNPRHLLDNLAAGSGPVPDAATAARMESAFDALG